VINAFTTIAESAITDERIWINAPDVIQLPVVNQSASILNTGNLVRRDTGTGGYPFSINTTTTESDTRVLGIIQGRTAASGGAGYVVTQGVVAVICDEAVAIGDYLEASTTAGQAQKIVTATGIEMPFGVVLTANTGAGTACLAYVNFNALMLTLPQVARITTGSYTGNGTDNRDITGVGFTPKYVHIQRATTDAGYFSFSSMPADTSFTFTGTAGVANAIQAFNSDGFQIGSSTPVNNSGSTFYYMCIG
jgi:hypothetical protein